jgi:hypothetical protein
MSVEQLEELNAYLMPGEFALWTDLNSKMLRSTMALMLVFFMLSQIVSIFLVYLILAALRKNSSTFSKNTYKLNIQLTLLLAVQVSKNTSDLFLSL